MPREPLPSDKFQVRERAVLMSPACCASCGNGTCREGYVDPDVYIEYEGQVYFCMNCAKEMAQAIGCLTPEESLYLENQNRGMAVELKELREKYERDAARLAVFDAVVISAGASAGVTPGSNPGTPESEPADAGSSKSADAGESESKEPVKVTGRTNVKRATVRNGSGLNL